jgi:hypothetical protein
MLPAAVQEGTWGGGSMMKKDGDNEDYASALTFEQGEGSQKVLFGVAIWQDRAVPG